MSVGELLDELKSLETFKESEQGNVNLDVKKRKRAVGISSECENTRQKSITKFEKDDQLKDLLIGIMRKNEFIGHFSDEQIIEVVDYLERDEFPPDSKIIEEGSPGEHVFVLEEGELEISQKEKLIRHISEGSVFGELAVLYNCQRTATVLALSRCVTWKICRSDFKSIIQKTRSMKNRINFSFLQSVPSFQHLASETLASLADKLDEVHYKHGEYILTQGQPGDSFYIIFSGTVIVTQNVGDNHHGEPCEEIPEEYRDILPDGQLFIRLLTRGDWFGERALKQEDVRSANIIAVSDNGVDCLVLDRESYKLLICDLEGFTKEYPDESFNKISSEILEKLTTLSLKDFTVIATLGVGGFGRVELVRVAEDNEKTFALKQLKKHHIVLTRQQQHVINEKIILTEINSSFIVKLYKTFKDRKYLYFLLEPCLGGELWGILRDHVHFDEKTAQFYVACVIEALSYLHLRGIVYRDLKPENLLLDSLGYCKLTDFGFSKKIGHGQKTWTFCGTPEYTAPEIILNCGHDFAVDYWSLGVLTFELLTGSPPFIGDDHMKIYNSVLKGIDSIDFPKKINRHQQNLIKKLCRDNASERIGYGKSCFKDIASHAWFDNFEWEALRQHKIHPPIVPQVKSPIDTSNFDSYPQELDTNVPDDMTGWDNDF